MSESESAASDVAQADRRESFNMRILATQLIIMRVGWIFKTESVIIPAVLDVISGAAWVRGLLPVLNRLGQSLPPMLLADTIRGVGLKKRALIFTTLGMALPFLTLASVWRMLDNRQQPWLVILFLVLYLVFFSATGLNQLVDGTLQGKLIRPTHRGRVMGRAGMLGSLGAVLAALFLLRPWLALPNHDGFAYIFLFNGSAYFIAGLMANLCQEAPDDSTSVTRKPWWSAFRAAWEVVRDDGRFRRAATVSILFMMGLLLFPHYQWLAREQLGSTHGDLIWWVIAQNISVGVLSPIVGRLADRFGNRLALRVSFRTDARYCRHSGLASFSIGARLVLDHVCVPRSDSGHDADHFQLHAGARSARAASALSEHDDCLLHAAVCDLAAVRQPAGCGAVSVSVPGHQWRDPAERPADVSYGRTSARW